RSVPAHAGPCPASRIGADPRRGANDALPELPLGLGLGNLGYDSVVARMAHWLAVRNPGAGGAPEAVHPSRVRHYIPRAKSSAGPGHWRVHYGDRGCLVLDRARALPIRIRPSDYGRCIHQWTMVSELLSFQRARSVLADAVTGRARSDGPGDRGTADDSAT